MSAKRRRVIFALLLVVIVGGAVCLFWLKTHKIAVQEIVLHGNVDIRQVDLAFRVGGRISQMLVEEGATVEKGQTLAILDQDLLEQQRDQAKASLDGQKADLARLEKGYRSEEIAQARASVNAARAIAENSAINLRRVQGLRARNAVSQRELDNARANDREAAAHLKSARDNLEMLESGYREEDVLAQKAAVAGADAQYRRAEIELADATLYAPQKGVILTRAREVGAIVQAGQTVYTLTLTDPVWLRAYVAEPELGRIKPGMPVRIAVDAAPGKFFQGTVGFISPVAEFTPKTVETREIRTSLVYRIRVTAQDPENVMRQGMPVTIYVDNE